MYHSPGNTMYGRPVRIVEMGITELSIDIIEQFIGEMSQEKYAADSYHLLRNNCNDFTNDLCQFLVGKCIPSNITGLPGEFLSTELGQQLGVHLDGMFTRETDEQTSMTQLYGQELSNSPNSVPVLQSKSQLENIDIALVVYIDRTQGRLIASELKTIVETHGRIPKGVWGSGNVGISAFTAGTELVEGNKRLPVAVVYHRGKNAST